MKNEPTDQCANPDCECPAQRDTGFCSEYCRFIEQQPAHTCLCGHPECEGDFEAAIEDSLFAAA